MTLSNVGKNRVRDLVDADLGFGVLGTGTATPLATDVGLSSSVLSSNNNITTSVTDKQIISDYTLPATNVTGSTITEFGIFTSGSTLMSRFVFSDLTHPSTEEWQFSTRHWIN